MAGSRLERIGTIYTRTVGLIQSKALKWEDRPLWYDVYEAFPPKEEPRYDRPTPNMKLKNIFYQEDKVRAIFHRSNKHIGAISLQDPSKTLTQSFIDIYMKLSDQYKDKASEEQLYKEAIELLNRDRDRGINSEIKKETDGEEGESVSLSLAFKEAQKKQQEGGINIKDIFKV